VIRAHKVFESQARYANERSLRFPAAGAAIFQILRANRVMCSRELATYRFNPVSWSISVTGMLRSRSSCGESLERWRKCAASRLRASLERGPDAFALIIEDVVVVCTSGTSRELLDDGLADPVDSSSFWASWLSVMLTPPSPSSARRETEVHMRNALGQD
jgi:hypothetical protein